MGVSSKREERTMKVLETWLLLCVLTQTSPETPKYSKHSKNFLVTYKISIVRLETVNLNLIRR